ncbi:MAG: amidophosphoribosyltransferase [Pseudomonadota bacterium]
MPLPSQLADGGRQFSKRRLSRDLARRVRRLQHGGYAAARHPATGEAAADTLREECGVVGIYRHPEAAKLSTLCLHALQHRGQEAVGIISKSAEDFHAERRIGLVSDGINKRKVQRRLKGDCAIGHVRYSTAGEVALRNVQPLYGVLSDGGFAVSHNGNITNALTLRRDLIESGAIFQSSTDSEVVLHLVARSKAEGIVERFIDALGHIEGGYAFVALSEEYLIGARDPNGIRPLIVGRLDGAYVFVSETCALDTVGATFVREVENGEIVFVGADGRLQSRKPFGAQPERPCVFEFVYFARPDSIVHGKSVYAVRKAIGHQLAQESAVEADVVCPIPDSGVPAALGFAEALGIPFEFGIIRNHYIGRTFIEPEQKIRDLGVRLKHSANAGPIAGKRVVLVDDSVVRGTTSRKIVNMMYQAGAKEVHMRIACPPIRYPDFYGIDTPKREELLAATHTVQEMRDEMGAATLAFLSLDGLYAGLGYEPRDADHPALTDHCFTGDYPTDLTDRKNGLIGCKT